MKNIGLVMLDGSVSFPSQVPFEMDDDWNDDVQFEISNFFHADKVDENWTALISVHVINSSVNRDWAVDLTAIKPVS